MCLQVTTDAQWIANRLNALKSTGPRSAAGQRASAQNAKTHGLTTPLTSVDARVRALADALAVDVPAECAEQCALRIAELERAEQAARDALVQGVEPEQTVVDGLTGIPLTAELLSQLPNHFSPSEIEALLGRAVVREDTRAVNQTLKRVNACERYLKRSANQMMRRLREALDD